MQTSLSTFSAVALVTTSASATAAIPSSGARSGASAAEEAHAELSREQRIGQLFMVATPVDTVSCDLRSVVRDQHVGNVILMGRSTKGANHIRSVTTEVQQLTESQEATGGIPACVCADQEGGQVQVLRDPGYSARPSAVEQGTQETDALRRDARRWASQLSRCGVNTHLGPDADLAPFADNTLFVMTDDAGNATALEDWSPAQRVTELIDAGGDMVLTAYTDTLPQMVAGVQRKAASDPAFAKKVDEASLHVLQGKEEAGLLEPRVTPTGTYTPWTTKRIQTWLGLKETGKLDPETIGLLQYRVGAATTGRWDARCFRALQTYLGMSPDGTTTWDERTTTQLQRYLNTQR